MLVGRTEFYPDPLTERWRVWPNVHRHIESCAVHHADQFALGHEDRVGNVSRAARLSWSRNGCPAQKARDGQTELLQFGMKTLFIEAFHKPAAPVFVDGGLDQHDVGDGGGGEFHGVRLLGMV